MFDGASAFVWSRWCRHARDRDRLRGLQRFAISGARRCVRIVLASLLLCTSVLALSQTRLPDAPNVVPITDRLITSGQPQAAALGLLAKQGFGAVIYLAPSTVPDAVANEAEIVQAQGMQYVNIPIKFNNPTAADFDAFIAAMAQLQDRKVLVHCQVNMRASSMVFLYRVIVLKQSAETAYEAVAKVWSPEGVWKDFIVSQLRKYGNDFEPY